MEQKSLDTKKGLKKWLIIGGALLLIVSAVVIWLIATAKQPIKVQPVKVESSLVEKQLELEEKLTIDDATFGNPKIVVNPYGLSPLTALVMFKTDKPVGVHVKVIGKDALTSFEHTFNETTEHRLPIYGLYAGEETQVEIKVGDRTKTLAIKAGALPEEFPKVIEVKADKTRLTNSLYFLTPSSANAKTSAYDVNGDLRWYLTEDFGWEVKRVKNGRLILSTERLSRAPYYNTGFYEMDLLGKVYREYTIPGGYHHDIYQRKNGNFIVATDGIEDGRKTVEDVVVEIDYGTGNVVKTIDLSKIWSMDTGKSIAWTADDWFHNNSVWLDEERDELILSGRHQDAVAVLSYKDSSLKYIIGSPDGWSEDMQEYFLKPVGSNFEWQWEQHAAKVLPNGDIMIFDNGNNKTKNPDKQVPAEKSYSRSVIYRVNRTAKTIEQIWQYGKERGANYYSPYISDNDYLGAGHFLVHSGGVNSKDGVPSNLPAAIIGADMLRSYTTEILNNQVIFELVIDQNYYRAEKMPVYVAQDINLQLGKAVQLGRLPATELCSNIPLNKARPVDEEYEKHKIELKREYDRLVMTGEFDKKSIVRLSLRGGNKKQQLTYRMPVDKETESQALCIDIMNYEHQSSGETAVPVNYVNATDLSGEYRIYISIGDKVYDTGELVKF